MSSAVGLLQTPPGGRLNSAVGRVAMSIFFVAGLAVPSASAALPVAAQASTVSFSTAEAAPADAISYIVTTTDDRSEQWRLADSLFDRAGFGEAIDEAVAEGLKDEAGQDLPLDAFLGGEVAVVITSVALDTLAQESMGGGDLDAMLAEMGMATPETEATDEPAPQGFAVVLDARAPDTAWAGIRESALQGQAEESTYEGTTILYAPAASEDDEAMAAAKAGDHILISTAPADLYPLIDTIDGRTPNITTLPEFSAAQAALPAEFLTFSFFNSLADADLDLGPFAAASEGLITDSYSASTIAADEPGFRIESVMLPGEGATLPPAAESFQSELVDLAPDNTILFMSGPNLGETGVLDAIGAALLGLAFGMGDPSTMGATPEPDETAQDVIAKQYQDAAALIGVNLQTDLFQQFTGEYGGWLTANLETEEVSGLWSSKVADPATVGNALMQLSFLIQGATGSETPLTTREVGGGQVYVIDLGDEAGSTLEFGVVGDRFVIGKGDAVDRLSGDGGDALSGNAQFLAVMDTLPVEGNGTLYIDLAQAIPLMEVASAQADDFGMGGDEITDASETCANYTTQEEAQAAYDAAEPDTFDLDQDFDGQACEDFFVAAETGDEAAEEDTATQVEDAFAKVDYSAIKAFAVVTHEEDGLQRSSGILYISE